MPQDASGCLQHSPVRLRHDLLCCASPACACRCDLALGVATEQAAPRNRRAAYDK